ncbi:methylmalonate-semialdehyde dehydrogenase, partial [Pseudomonas syringae pv. actinidiae ICMP 19096]
MSESPVIGHYINGQANNGDGERYSDVFNPAIGTVQARVALASVKTVDEAV